MKSVIFDFNNTAIRCLHGEYVITKETDGTITNIDWDLWRFYTFSAIYNVFFHVKNINEIVLAVDSNKYWRTAFYSPYKYKRSAQREKSEIDWDLFYEKYNEFQTDLKENLPFKLLKIPFCEGDDIIGVLCLNTPKDHKWNIISVDSDFLQLSSDRVEIYNPLKKSIVSHPNTEFFIQNLCLTGQGKDNIYNVTTPVDWPKGLRLPGFGEKAAEKAFIMGLDKFLNQSKKYEKKIINENDESVEYKSTVNFKERYEQNRILIDFKKIPEEIVRVVLNNYNNYKYPNAEKIIPFFQKYNWRDFMENITKTEQNLMGLY